MPRKTPVIERNGSRWYKLPSDVQKRKNRPFPAYVKKRKGTNKAGVYVFFSIIFAVSGLHSCTSGIYLHNLFQGGGKHDECFFSLLYTAILRGGSVGQGSSEPLSAL